VTGLIESLVVAAVGLTSVAGLATFRLRRQERWDAGRQWLELYLPPELSASNVTDFVRPLAGLGRARTLLAPVPNLVFEVTTSTNGRRVLIGVPAGRVAIVAAHLRAHLPSVVLIEAAARPVPTAVAAVELTCHIPNRSLRTDQPDALSRGLATALATVRPGETLLWQWVVTAGPDTAPQVRDWRRLLTGRPVPAPTTKETQDKHAEPLFAASCRVGATAGSMERATALLRQAQAGTAGLWRGEVRLTRRLPARLVVRRLQHARTPLFEPAMTVNARELAVLLGWPTGQQHDRFSRRLLPATDTIPATGRVLGYSTLVGASRLVAYSASDSLHHSHVIGPTGVGKSTLLASLAVQAIASGAGVVVIDPKADLIERILERIPAERYDDVIVLDPTDETRPVGMNLLEDAHRYPERVSDQVVGIFHRLFAQSWGPRTADVLHAALLTLAHVPGMTLCELPQLLVDEGFRRRLVARVNDPLALDSFWSWYEALTPGERSQVVAPVLNKVRAFLLRRRVRNVIGQAEGTWSIEDVLNRRRILLVSLAKGELGPEAGALIGSLVVARLWQAIQRPAVRAPVAVFIDEFQDLVGTATDLAEVLAQARGFGVGITLAHQHLGQLSPDLRAAVLANARSRIVFQTAADDAAVLAKQLGGGRNPTDLTSLPAHEAYASLCIGGAVQDPVSITTDDLREPTTSGQGLRHRSREHYGRNQAEVEAAILARQQVGATAGETLGRRRRAS